MNWFGKKKTKEVKSTPKSTGNAQDAILRLRTAIETQEKR